MRNATVIARVIGHHAQGAMDPEPQASGAKQVQDDKKMRTALAPTAPGNANAPSNWRLTTSPRPLTPA